MTHSTPGWRQMIEAIDRDPVAVVVVFPGGNAVWIDKEFGSWAPWPLFDQLKKDIEDCAAMASMMRPTRGSA